MVILQAFAGYVHHLAPKCNNNNNRGSRVFTSRTPCMFIFILLLLTNGDIELERTTARQSWLSRRQNEPCRAVARRYQGGEEGIRGGGWNVETVESFGACTNFYTSASNVSTSSSFADAPLSCKSCKEGLVLRIIYIYILSYWINFVLFYLNLVEWIIAPTNIRNK